jgi:hypothetical protein
MSEPKSRGRRARSGVDENLLMRLREYFVLLEELLLVLLVGDLEERRAVDLARHVEVFAGGKGPGTSLNAFLEGDMSEVSETEPRIPHLYVALHDNGDYADAVNPPYASLLHFPANV